MNVVTQAVIVLLGLKGIVSAPPGIKTEDGFAGDFYSRELFPSKLLVSGKSLMSTKQ